MASVSRVRVVQAHGCFDLLHLGHIRHLQAAKAAGDYLVVTVTADRFIRKGPGRPAFTQEQRMEALRGLSCVDNVSLSEGPTAADDIRLIRPAVFVKGSDYSEDTIDPGERDAIAEVGARLVITHTEKWSSTALLQPHPDVSEEIRSYLSGLTFSADHVIGWLEKARALNVVVIGDAILDDYHYVEVMGKAGKEPILASKFIRSEQYVGGADAVARHAEACSDHVTCLTGPPVIKRRFVETYPFQKLSEVYYDFDEVAASQAGLTVALTKRVTVADADLVIVADYGHGFVTSVLTEHIQRDAKFLAVNVQANAGNHGYHTISKYRRADFISLSERELRLDARDQTTCVGQLMADAAASRQSTVLVTRGAHGCQAIRRGRIVDAPALATHTVDRVGAGDAVFAVAACCAAVGMPLDVLTFIAAVVGTLAVGIVGNARYIERDALHREIRRWLQ